MGNLQDFTQALTHWSFGVAILVGLVSSEFSGAETVAAIFVAGFSSTLSGKMEILYHCNVINSI